MTAVGWLLARGGVYPSRWAPDIAVAVRGFATTHHQALVVIASIGIVGCAIGAAHTWWSVRQIEPDNPCPPKARPSPPLMVHSDFATWQLGPRSWLLGGPWGLAVYGGDDRHWPWPVITIPPMPPEMVAGWLQQLPTGRAPAWAVVERMVRAGRYRYKEERSNYHA